MSTVQLPGSIRFDSQIQMHIGTEKDYVSIAKKFEENLTKYHRKYSVIDQEKSKQIHGNKMDRQRVSCSG